MRFGNIIIAEPAAATKGIVKARKANLDIDPEGRESEPRLNL